MARFPLLLLPLPFFLFACTPDSTSPTAQKTPGDDDKIQWQSATNLRNNGDLAGAAAIYEQIAQKNTTSVDAEIELAAIDRKLGKAADAVEVMKDAQKRQPDNQLVTTQLAYAMIDAGHSEEAVAIFDSLIRSDPSNALAYSGKGVAFDKAGNHLAAQDLYQQALKIAPGTLSIENNLAMSLILNNQLKQAIIILEKLSAQNPANKIVRHNLALAYGLNGDNGKALKLNLQDLPPAQAKENEKFYQYYAHMRDEFTDSGTSGMQIGFSETPDDDKNPVEKPKKVAKKVAIPVVKEAVADPEDPDDDDEDVAPEASDVASVVDKAASESKSAADLMPAANSPAMSMAPATPPTLSGTTLPTADTSTQNSDFPSQHKR